MKFFTFFWIVNGLSSILEVAFKKAWGLIGRTIFLPKIDFLSKSNLACQYVISLPGNASIDLVLELVIRKMNWDLINGIKK